MFVKVRPYFLRQLLSWIAIIGAIAYLERQGCAQTTPDGTLGEESSVVTPEDLRGKPSDRIDGGARRGANLFHSFQDFNVGEGRGAYFSNPDGVENILSRVTGGNPSQILGTLGVLGEANLFLVNPHGIVFGPNASLDVKGSFVSTTANGIGFGDRGLFSATNPALPSPRLTVDPATLFFNQVAAQPNNSIVVRGTLAVPNSQSLLLVGGTLSPTPDAVGILVDGGALLAPGGRVELGGLAEAGTVKLASENSWQLIFPEEGARTDVIFDNEALVGVLAGDGGGSIAISARNLAISKESQLQAGIAFELGTPPAQAGEIAIQATGTVSLASASAIVNVLETGVVGRGGNIEITTGSLSVVKGSFLFASTSGQGNAGNIEINASESVAFEGVDSTGLPSGAFSSVEPEAVGNGGKIEITTGSLSLAEGAQLVARTSGQGDAGNIEINASESVAFEGVDSTGLPSGAFSIVEPEAVGNGGKIEINASSLLVAEGAKLNATTRGQGDAGQIVINASETVSFEGGTDDSFRDEVSSEVFFGAQGNSGGIEITTGSLSVTDGAELSTSTLGQGNAGNIIIRASESVVFEGKALPGIFRGGALSTVEGAVGKGGDINITTSSLSLAEGATLSAKTNGRGDAGSIIIRASESVVFESSSGVVSQVAEIAEGEGGNIEITTSSLALTGGARLSAGTFGKGDSGDIIIRASESVVLKAVDGNGFSGSAFSGVGEEAEGNGGDIKITTGTLLVADGNTLFTSTFGQGDSGDIIIRASESVVFKGAGKFDFELPSGAFSSTSTGAEGKGGRLAIITDSLALTEGAELNASTSGQGRGGDIRVSANSLALADEAQIDSRSFGPEDSGEIIIAVGSLQADDSQIATSSAQAAGGAIDITAAEIRLRGDSNIRTEVASGTGGGGDITLTAESIIAFDDSDIFAFAQSQGGDINLDTPAFFGSRFQPDPESAPDTLNGNERVDINASGAVSGAISLPDVSFLQNSLSELPDNVINTETLITNSCVTSSGEQRGTFIITGAGGLPIRPGAQVTAYSTGEVRTVPHTESSDSGDRPWQKGDPIVEPQGVYRLADGKLVMSRRCL